MTAAEASAAADAAWARLRALRGDAAAAAARGASRSGDDVLDALWRAAECRARGDALGERAFLALARTLAVEAAASRPTMAEELLAEISSAGA